MALGRKSPRLAVKCERNAEVGVPVSATLDLDNRICLRWQGQAEERIPFGFTEIF